MQDRAKEISSLESAAVAQKEKEIKSLTETLASTVAKFENLQKENAELRNLSPLFLRDAHVCARAFFHQAAAQKSARVFCRSR